MIKVFQVKIIVENEFKYFAMIWGVAKIPEPIDMPTSKAIPSNLLSVFFKVAIVSLNIFYIINI